MKDHAFVSQAVERGEEDDVPWEEITVSQNQLAWEASLKFASVIFGREGVVSGCEDGNYRRAISMGRRFAELFLEGN